MKVTKEQLRQIIKEELGNVVDESQSSSQIYSIKTRAEKMADRAAKEKFYDRPRVEYTDDEKATRAKNIEDGRLRSKFEAASAFEISFPRNQISMATLTPEEKMQGIEQGLDKEFESLWVRATA